MRKLALAALAATSILSCPGAHATERRVAPQATPIALFKAIYGQYPESEPADAWHKADKEWLGKNAELNCSHI